MVSVGAARVPIQLTIDVSQRGVFLPQAIQFILEDLQGIYDLRIGDGNLNRGIVHTKLDRYLLSYVRHLDLLTE